MRCSSGKCACVVYARQDRRLALAKTLRATLDTAEDADDDDNNKEDMVMVLINNKEEDGNQYNEDGCMMCLFPLGIVFVTV
jgi:hypothetical protein